MKKEFILLNVIAPVLIGAILYYLFFPEAVFVRLIDNLLGSSYHIPVNVDNILIKLIRFYLLDFLWAYALMSAVILIFKNDSRVFVIILIFEIVLELIQLLPSIRGTFDVCDIGIEILASIFVIKLSRRRFKNEKDIQNSYGRSSITCAAYILRRRPQRDSYRPERGPSGRCAQFAGGLQPTPRKGLPGSRMLRFRRS